jgi:hypothetical protein
MLGSGDINNLSNEDFQALKDMNPNTVLVPLDRREDIHGFFTVAKLVHSVHFIFVMSEFSDCVMPDQATSASILSEIKNAKNENIYYQTSSDVLDDDYPIQRCEDCGSSLVSSDSLLCISCIFTKAQMEEHFDEHSCDNCGICYALESAGAEEVEDDWLDYLPKNITVVKADKKDEVDEREVDEAMNRKELTYCMCVYPPRSDECELCGHKKSKTYDDDLMMDDEDLLTYYNL